MMKKVLHYMIIVSLLTAIFGCTHPMRKLKNVDLGMTPDEVEDEMGKPYAVRSKKIFANEETTMVWEYHPPLLHPNENLVHIVFENDKVVQWGKPGDYNTGSEKKVQEYKDQKSGR